MAASNDAKNLMLDALLQGAAIYVSLHTADPGTTGAGEVSGGSYSRASSTFSVASNGQSSNTQQIVWTDLPGCTVTHCGVWRGSTFLFGATLTQPRTILAGDGFFFRPSTVVVQVP